MLSAREKVRDTDAIVESTFQAICQGRTRHVDGVGVPIRALRRVGSQYDPTCRESTQNCCKQVAASLVYVAPGLV